MRWLLAILISLALATNALAAGAAGSTDPADLMLPNGVLLRAQSLIDPAAADIYVSTGLSLSADQGKTFSDPTVVNQSVDVGAAVKKFETPTLAYSPGGDLPFFLIYNVMLSTAGIPDLTSSYLAMRQSANPSLGWESEIAILAGTSYGGAAPHYTLPDSASDCLVVNEPSLISAPGGGLYLVFGCHAAADDRIHLAVMTPNTLIDLGALLTASDAALFKTRYASQFPELATMTNFAAPDLFSAGGRLWMLVSPADATGKYLGCALLTMPVIRDSAGVPSMFRYIQGTVGKMRGACSYNPAGISLSNNNTPFSITQTGKVP